MMTVSKAKNSCWIKTFAKIPFFTIKKWSPTSDTTKSPMKARRNLFSSLATLTIQRSPTDSSNCTSKVCSSSHPSPQFSPWSGLACLTLPKKMRRLGNSCYSLWINIDQKESWSLGTGCWDGVGTWKKSSMCRQIVTWRDWRSIWQWLWISLKSFKEWAVRWAFLKWEFSTGRCIQTRWKTEVGSWLRITWGLSS